MLPARDLLDRRLNQQTVEISGRLLIRLARIGTSGMQSGERSRKRDVLDGYRVRLDLWGVPAPGYHEQHQAAGRILQVLQQSRILRQELANLLKGCRLCHPLVRQTGMT